MPCKLPKFLLSALIFLFLLSVPQPSWAQVENSSATYYQADYTVSPEANTQVDVSITLKNKISDVYVSSYSLTIGSNNVSYIEVSDSFGALVPKISKQENRTRISVDFVKKVIGKDNQNILKISYQTPDFAHINGEILEVSIPGISRKENLEGYQVNLKIPTFFGQASFIQPKPDSQNKNSQYLTYNFDKSSLIKFEGISAAFGELQVFDFRFYYQLKNPTGKKVLTEISLPADTLYQRVYYQKLEPQPQEIRLDQDNNWLAIYSLEKNQQLEIETSGSVEIYIREQQDLSYLPLNPEQIKEYTQPREFWESDNPRIAQLGQELETVDQIYRYVVENLIYDYGRLDGATARLGAVGILKDKSTALCTEFTDLFIALCRQIGVPAREVNGFAFTSNPQLRPLSLTTDVLHAWPQYYDFNKEMWIDVDPTWENTTGGIDYFNKLDLSHFSFVRHGISSGYPPPPGAFAFGEAKKNVFVDFGKKKEHFAQVQFQPKIPSQVIAGLPIIGQVKILNNGQSAYHHQILKISSSLYEKVEEIEVLPPFAQSSSEIFLPTKWNSQEIKTLVVQFADQKIAYQVKVIPVYKFVFQEIKSWTQKFLKF